MTAISLAQYEELGKSALTLDTRQAAVFTLGFIPGSINIGLGLEFVECVTALIPLDTPLVIISSDEDVADAYKALEILGYKNIKGHLEGGYETWAQSGKRSDMIIDISGDELALDIPFDTKLLLVDVRTPALFDLEHVKKAENFPLKDIVDPLHIAQLDEDANIYVYSQTGYRSVIACSVMKKEGFHNIRNIEEGFAALKVTPNIPLEKPKKEK